MTYTISLPNLTREAASAVEQRLRGLNDVEYVDINLSSETVTVTTTLTYDEIIGTIRQGGVSAN